MNVPDNDRANQEQFLELLRTFDPELAVIKELLLLTKLDSSVLIQIIKGLGNINAGTGYGRLTVNLHGHTVQGIITEERTRFTIVEEVEDRV